MTTHPDIDVELRMRCIDAAIRMEAGDVVAAAAGLYEFAIKGLPNGGGRQKAAQTAAPFAPEDSFIDQVCRDGITIETVTHPNGARQNVWRRRGAFMATREVDEYLQRFTKAPQRRHSLIRRLASALQAWASHGGTRDAG